MKVAIVGSREVPSYTATYLEIEALVHSLPAGSTVISGGAKGVDTLARMAARALGVTFVEYPADWEAHGKSAGFRRNQTIVDACDEVHAWWDGKSRGTADTIAKARKAGKVVVIHEMTTPKIHRSPDASES